MVQTNCTETYHKKVVQIVGASKNAENTCGAREELWVYSLLLLEYTSLPPTDFELFLTQSILVVE